MPAGAVVLAMATIGTRWLASPVQTSSTPLFVISSATGDARTPSLSRRRARCTRWLLDVRQRMTEPSVASRSAGMAWADGHAVFDQSRGITSEPGTGALVYVPCRAGGAPCSVSLWRAHADGAGRAPAVSGPALDRGRIGRVGVELRPSVLTAYSWSRDMNTSKVIARTPCYDACARRPRGACMWAPPCLVVLASGGRPASTPGERRRGT